MKLIVSIKGVPKMKFKVSKPGGWKYGFLTLEDAKAYASSVHARTGVIVAIVSYLGRKS